MRRSGSRNARETVVVGGGLAAQRFCETLRRLGHDGPIRMMCAEPVRPYDRPPLSKELLAGELESHALHLRPAEWYADNDVELVLGRRAEALDVALHTVTLEGASRCDSSNS